MPINIIRHVCIDITNNFTVDSGSGIVDWVLVVLQSAGQGRWMDDSDKKRSGGQVGHRYILH